MSELRMTEDEKRKKQREERLKKHEVTYEGHIVQQIDKAKKWNKENPSARKLIVERYKLKNNPNGVWSDGRKNGSRY